MQTSLIHICSCPTGLGSGGLGQHLAKVHADAVDAGFESRLYCHGGQGPVHTISSLAAERFFRYPPFRWRPDLRVWLQHAIFDRQVARELEPCDVFTGYMGGSLRSFQAARKLGVRHLVLEMANSHPENVRSLHAQATRRHGFERSWMGGLFEARALREILLADEIRTNSDYTSRSLVERGVPAGKIVRRHLGCDPRFGAIERRAHPQGLKEVVAVGSSTVVKGIPVLVEAFRRIQGDNLRLLLVGGWSSRGMRLWLEKARSLDPRIHWTTGDPAPHLATAAAAVHASWEDGWGYAPAEALAAGLPLAVTDQTGMKELLDRSLRQAILPVGDTQALVHWLRTILQDSSE